MNKKLLLGAVSVAALLTAGCSQDQTIELPSSSAISFSNVFVDKSTKTDAGSIEDFAVNGYVTSSDGTNQIFSNTKVSKNGSDWKYDNLQYWIAGAKYLFAAVSPYSVKDKVSSSVADGSIKTIITDFENDQTDLLYAAPSEITGAVSGNSVVALTFNHLLSKVKFTFTNGFPSTSQISLKVSNVKITDACKTGKVTLTGEQPNKKTGIAWEASKSETNKLELDFGNVTTTDANLLAPAESPVGVATDNSLLIIPTGDDVSYEVTFTVDVYQGTATSDEPAKIGTYNHTSTISNVAFTPGFSYNFTATLNKDNTTDNKLEPIVFTVSKVEEFESADDKTLTVNNSTTNTGEGN